MLPELEKPKVTEIQVRMDCNGCVQKIKKALHGINGIYDVYIDVPQQKVTIIGWADPEKIVKAIKKTRKTATICSHTTPSELESSLEEAPPSSDTTNTPREEAPPSEQTPRGESPLPPEDSQPDVAAPPQPTESTANQQPQYSGPKVVEEDHVVYHFPPDQAKNVRVYDRQVNQYPGSQGGLGFRHEPLQPIHVNHSYNTYKPTPYITEYQYIQPKPQYTLYSRQEPPQYTSYSWPEPSKQYTNYEKKPSYSRSEPPQPSYNRSEPPQPSYNRPEPPPHNYVQLDPSPPHHSRPYLTPSSHNQSQPPPQDRRPGPPQHYTQQELPQQNRQPEPPQHYTQLESLQRNRQQEPPQQNYHPEPPQQHTHYNRPEPPQQYTHYYYQELPQQYTLYGRPEPPSSPHAYYNRLEPPYSTHYKSAYYQSSNENDDITSAFGDEDPNGCKIV